MLFTSGTTSRPKGVEITHGNIRAQLSTFLSVYGYDANSRILNILPLHHTDGLMQGPVVAFIAGATVYRPGQFRVVDLPELMATVRLERITHFIVVPTMLSLMMRLDEKYNDSFKGSRFARAAFQRRPVGPDPLALIREAFRGRGDKFLWSNRNGLRGNLLWSRP